MLENQFIHFTEALPAGCGTPMPINRNHASVFYIPRYRTTAVPRVDMIGDSGEIVKANVANITPLGTAESGLNNNYCIASLKDLIAINEANEYIGKNRCFRLRVVDIDTSVPEVDSEDDFDLQITLKQTGVILLKEASYHPGNYTINFYEGLRNVQISYIPPIGKNPVVPTNVLVDLRVVDSNGNVIFDSGAIDIDYLQQELPVQFTMASETDIEVYLGIRRLDSYPIERVKSCYVALTDTITVQSSSTYVETIKGYSNMLVYTGTKDKQSDAYGELINDYSVVKCLCNEDAFGLPYSQHVIPASIPPSQWPASYINGILPLRLYAPQFTQEEETYEKANGEVVTLYAKYHRELEGVTEYLPESVHQKIVAALACDEVYINGVRVIKSDKYNIDWENYDLDCDGVTKLARATFKVRENTNQRNSNY